jgi:low temperature requirement protein LtrA
MWSNSAMAEELQAKRVSWVELYFDLILVFAVGQTTHIMVTEPHWTGFGRAVGLFIPLWWTWIGFVVLCNRNNEDSTAQRLFVLAGTVPCVVAAIETRAYAGHAMAFIFAIAGARVILSLAFRFTTEQGNRTAIGYGASAAAFVVSAFVPPPWRYVLWALALIQEAGFLLLDNDHRARQRRQRRDQDGTRERPVRPSRVDRVRAMLKPPADPSRRVDAGHLAERFGLMMIILLGEVVVAVAGSAAETSEHGARYWLGLLAGLVLAAALWWIYFIAAAPLSEYVLQTSGGNPSLAYGLYAGGHLGPAFALLTIAAGVGLTLSGHPATAAPWFITIGLVGFLVGTRTEVISPDQRFGRPLQIAVSAATVCLAFLEPVISATGVLLVAAAWAAALAAYVTRRVPERLKGIAADPLAYFRAGSSGKES